jgi:phosphate-selective porin OprO/OprP
MKSTTNLVRSGGPSLTLLALSVSLGFPASAMAQERAEIEALKQQLEEQRSISRRLEERINRLSDAQSARAEAPAPVASTHAGYDGGFYVKDASGANSLYVNGIVLPRFNRFETNGTDRYGGVDSTSNNFDIFLGRLYFSGSVYDPSVKYWFTLQGTTGGNGSDLTLLDAKVSKDFSPHLTVEFGKYWSAYTYQYYVDIGKYLLPDLSAAEWAFSLGRQIGARASGKYGRLGYSLSVSNSIRGSDLGTNQNSHERLATILNLNYDVLEPYGYQETDPGARVARPQLSVWASAMYNPVEHSSAFQNDLAGDKTYGGTASVNYRYGHFSMQLSGYYKKNEGRDGRSSFESHGWQEQAGYYLIPGKLEVAQRIDQVRWGRGQIAATGGKANQWYAGPANFSFRRLTEYTAGLNHYLHGHKVKTQLAYSYLDGRGFDDGEFDARRILLQAQVAF